MIISQLGKNPKPHTGCYHSPLPHQPMFYLLCFRTTDGPCIPPVLSICLACNLLTKCEITNILLYLLHRILKKYVHQDLSKAANCVVACPGFHQSLARMPLLCTGLCIYLKSHQQKFRSFWSIFQAGPSIFVNTKEFQKNTKENMPLETFCSHFSKDGPINLIPSSDCYICIALSIDSHIGYPGRHISIWSYGHILPI